MKKSILLIVITLALLSNINAQSPKKNNNFDTTATASKYIYCELLGVQKFLSTKVIISIDFGEYRGLFQDTRMRDDSGKVQSFNSMVDALNYMGKYGWEFSQAYTVSSGQQHVYHWLLKKEIDK